MFCSKDNGIKISRFEEIFEQNGLGGMRITDDWDEKEEAPSEVSVLGDPPTEE